MRYIFVILFLVTAICSVGYVHAQDAAVPWPDRATLIDYIDNHPGEHLATLETILAGLAVTPRKAAMDAIWTGAFGKATDAAGADLVRWEQRAEQYLGRDVEVTETETDIVITVPKE